jgi:hypothetical protein
VTRATTYASQGIGKDAKQRLCDIDEMNLHSLYIASSDDHIFNPSPSIINYLKQNADRLLG